MFNALLEFNARVLQDSQAVLGMLSDDEYCYCPGKHHEGTIGQHMRHIADHYRALEKIENGVLSYQSRRRNTLIESVVHVAIAEFSEIERILTVLQPGPIAVIAEVNFLGGASVSVDSSIARELAFVASHAVHHHAMIAVLLHALGKQPPANLGVAPATLGWRSQLAG